MNTVVNSLPKVSVMIPTYNQSEFILKAIDSALAQSYGNLEVIVLDDASTDDTELKLSSIRDYRFKYIRNKVNLGRAANYRNLLINYASGVYVVNLDGDDYFTDKLFIEEAVKLFQISSRVVLVAAKVSWLSNNVVIESDLPKKKRLLGMEVIKKLPASEYLLMHMGVLYCRDLALGLNFYNSSAISSDWESLYRLAIYGEIAYLDRVVGVWRIHGLNETGTRDPSKLLLNLSIWSSIYSEANKLGMPKFLSISKQIQCQAFFGLSSCICMATLSNASLLNFFRGILVKYPLTAVFIIFNLRYSLRLLLGLVGYYRNKRVI